MNQSKAARRQIIQATAAAMEQYSGKGGRWPRPERLCAGLRAKTVLLRRQYGAANHAKSRRPVDEWLCDNYYILEKESKQAVRDIRQLAKQGDAHRILLVCHVFSQVLSALLPEITDETLSAILGEIEGYQPLSELQFSIAPSAVKAALVEIAFHAVSDNGDPDRIAYAVTGLNKLSAIDMQEIIRGCSSVERLLMQDPAEIYPSMDDDSRLHYRHLVALIARRAKMPEQQIAKELLAASAEETDRTRRHVGYTLTHHTALVRPKRRRGMAALVTGALLPALASLLIASYLAAPWLVPLLLLPLWEILRSLLQQAFLAGVEPSFIPRMDMSKVENRPKTVVLISTLLPKAADAPALATRLEQLYFSNSDPDLYFCVLADFKEWDFPGDEKDESQLAATRKVIRRLNEQYGGRFMLFLRGRVYNKTQKRYSGWERKRGAITEFIRFLKGEKTSVHTFEGNREVLPCIRYCIALDADTELLYESAQTLVSAAAHPLNRLVIDSRGVVVDGYGILAPKISPDLDSAKATPFSRVMSGCGGVTAYESRGKDFYQDLFGESIFAGKGLIDIEAFHQLLDRRFPENRVLSHDILEGAYLRCGFVSDVEMTDGTPSGMISWLARLHRWLRGDWQNITFLPRSYRAHGQGWSNPISGLSRYKLFDNLRRPATTICALLCVLLAPFTSGPTGLILGLAGVLAVAFPPLWAAVHSLLTVGVVTVSRKFFTRTLPHTFELLAQGVLLLVMLPAQALTALDAILRSLWRLFASKKNLLEWTTAAQSDAGKNSVAAVLRRFWLAELLGLGYMAVSLRTPFWPLGLLFALVVPVAYYSAKPTAEGGSSLSSPQRDELLSYNAAMWRYYEDFANAANHYLPPDNVQQSPVYRVATRTSPTNIGMMLLSMLAARDMEFIDTDGLYERVSRTLDTVEHLPRWKGNLYNWYDTETLQTLQPEFISTVDSGNFIGCLVALGQGLRALIPEKPEMRHLAQRINRLVDDTDLLVLYNKKKHLFSIGYDAPSGTLVDSHYDFLMSEARLTSYYAVARKIVSKKHWGALNRTMSKKGAYAGPVSWTGTMFEYFMPHLLLPTYEGSLLSESLFYCLYCQRQWVKAKAPGTPWGISESAFYAFDNNLNYQYKAHGVQSLGVKRGLDRELVISPYSTFITIPFNPNSSMRNLRQLRDIGVYGRYGFFEAVDFTRERVGSGLAVTRSYMAHHIGMSMLASCNALFDGRMVKRFMADPYMRSAKEFLQEKLAKNAVVYDQLKTGGASSGKQEKPLPREEEQDLNPCAPHCRLLTNGELTDILTGVGAGHLKFGDIDLTRPGDDLLRHPQGIYAIARAGDVALSATRAPAYDPDMENRLEQQDHSVTFYGKKGGAEIGMRCMMHPTLSCEQRQIVIRGGSGARRTAQALIYLEPVLSRYNDYNAHPAYSKLFVTAHRDEQSRTVTFSRRNRDGVSDMFLTVGFLEELDYRLETRREVVFADGNGMGGLLRFHEKAFASSPAADPSDGVPDPCCAILFDLPMTPGGDGQATLLLSAARTEVEGIRNIITIRNQGLLEPKQAAGSPLLSQSLEARIGARLLGQLLFSDHDSSFNLADKQQNQLGQSGLWGMGISGDLPIVLLEIGPAADLALVESYLKLHSALRALNVEFDLCVLYGDIPGRDALWALVEKHGATILSGVRGGIFLLEQAALSQPTLTLLRATARHRMGSLPGESPAPYLPVKFAPVLPEALPASPDLGVHGGCFHAGRFHVDSTSPLPWCHALTNSQFGTLVSHRALGFTWAINSRENKLTPWTNDIAADNTGELCVLRDGGEYFDLTDGARASFQGGDNPDARYDGHTPHVCSSVRVHVSGRGCAKYVDVTLRNTSGKHLRLECAYYIEPVLGVNRDTARHIQISPRDDKLLLHNPYNTAVTCWAALRGKGGADDTPRFTTDRAAFLCGRWQDAEIIPRNDPCAAVILPVSLAAGQECTLRFTLTYGRTSSSAAYMADAALPPSRPPEHRIRIDTPDPCLNQLINHFVPHQILSSRIQGRCAFYQCGGAYGFRDQLQDVTAYQLLDPAVARNQILRCCAVQFEEGDVLHWWHNLPKNAGGLRGVRTRFSDDLLWLPLATAEYVLRSGDDSILDLLVAYLHAPELEPGRQEQYIAPERSALRESVYDHCVRALERGCRLDEKGLPYIGCGDWNDGFSAVGREGRGTSVWLALFLSVTLTRFSQLALLRKDLSRSQQYLRQAEDLRKAVDAHCWDGAWYIRAFFDNGEAMGSHKSDECQIDLLPQTFAVLSGMPDRTRVDTALQNAWDRLVDRELALVRLFDLPFQHSAQQPGYVKAYPSGLRENGGQYTHSAVWFAMALLLHGDTAKGWELLDMLNPVSRTLDPARAEVYKLEPYSIAADIYTHPGAEGRGGWSMYTGAASWYYRAVVEVLLGVRLQGDRLFLRPHLPPHWEQASMQVTFRDTALDIRIRRGDSAGLTCNGNPVEAIPLTGGSHSVELTLS